MNPSRVGKSGGPYAPSLHIQTQAALPSTQDAGDEGAISHSLAGLREIDRSLSPDCSEYARLKRFTFNQPSGQTPAAASADEAYSPKTKPPLERPPMPTSQSFTDISVLRTNQTELPPKFDIGRRRSAATLSRPSSISGVQIEFDFTVLIAKVKQATQGPLILSEDQQKVVDGGFVLPEHVIPISMALDFFNAGASIRETGKLTLDKLRLGCEPKGPEYTEENTLKESSIKRAYSPTTARSVFEAAQNAGILGYVATLQPDQTALLEMGKKSVARLETSIDRREKALSEALKPGPNGPRYFIDFNDLVGSLRTLKDVDGWGRLPMTGDYDLHCAVSFRGMYHTVPSRSREEAELLAALNAAISAVDDDRPLGDSQMALFKHGPQVNYPAYKMETGASMKRQIAEPDFPVAWYAKGEWTIVKNRQELEAVYEKYKVALKDTWSRRDSSAFLGPEDHVIFSRRRSSSQRPPFSRQSSGNTVRSVR